MSLRKAFFWFHLCSGVVAGVVILIMSVTGVLLTYEQQMIAWAERDYRVQAPSNAAKRLSWDELVSSVRQVREAEPTSVVMRQEAGAPVAFSYGREVLYVNPYTGAVLGEGATGVRRFFRAVTDWHRWLGRQGESRDGGRAITGICNLAFLFLVMSGFYLWWPRQWGWRRVRSVLWFRSGLKGKARDFNWHNAIGFWCAIPLFLIVLSGVVMSYPWANDLIYKITGDPVPARAGGPGSAPAARAPERRAEASARRPSTEAASDFKSLDELWRRAQTEAAEWRVMTLRMPGPEQKTAGFSIEGGSRGRVDLRSQLEIDRTTGKVVKRETFEDLSTGRRIRMWLRFIHTGEAAGIAGQTIAGIASAGAAVLVWTGLMLALRRFRSWQTRGQVRVQQQEEREKVAVGV